MENTAHLSVAVNIFWIWLRDTRTTQSGISLGKGCFICGHWCIFEGWRGGAGAGRWTRRPCACQAVALLSVSGHGSALPSSKGKGKGRIKAAAVDDHIFLERLICMMELDSFYKWVIRNPQDSEENPKHVILSVGGGNWVLTPPFPVESVGGKCILSRP